MHIFCQALMLHFTKVYSFIHVFLYSDNFTFIHFFCYHAILRLLLKKLILQKYFKKGNKKISYPKELNLFDKRLSEKFIFYIFSGAATPRRRNASFKTIEVALIKAKRPSN